jgi:hypothetical protein
MFARIVTMRIAVSLVRFLDQRSCTPGLSGQGSNYASECLVGAATRLLSRQRGQGMSDAHDLIVRVAKRFGVVAGGIHEGLGAEEHRWDAAIFEGQDIVHTARYT